MHKLLPICGMLLVLAAACTSAPAAPLLVDALKAGDLAAVQKALQEGGDPNAAETDGTTALHWAVQMNRLDMVSALIAAGADVNVKNRFGAPPLMLAATNGNASITDAMLRAGADALAKVPETGTVLMAAARTGNPDIVTALLAKGADPNTADPITGQTPLMWAAAEGHAAAVKALLAGGANIRAQSHDKFSALFFAVRKGDIGSVDALVLAGADVNETTEPQDTPNCDMYCKQYPAGTKISPKGDSMLVVAILNAHYELADFLLTKGADPNAAGTHWAPLHALERIRNYEETQYPAPRPTGNLDSLELAKHLFAHGADPKARANTITASRGDGAGDQNYQELKGATPFFLAAKGADIPMMHLLLANRADFTTPIDDHTTPLMIAAGIGCVPGQWIEPERDVLQAVKLMVEELKADVNAENDRHETALHGAVCRGADSVVQYLVDQGARLDVKDIEGQTPLDVAINGITRPIRIGGPDIILFKFPLHTAALLKNLMAQHSAGSGSVAALR
jgi:ankyrin repeat protein